ncbi:hypothetical protein [Methylobacterium haplocladii]|uniref:Uncharacterized protein n=1 Tax=Methylobacterium haplocladii TaxID=1176176 RepID=A0A512IR87_9HYPH|nr:hypothetical protein [Methylobacterium haplocladii]GEP00193.1 hypothetical protein MHA02_25800 [Methylobacterium haplocladii]GJD83751.1 hypothetical protein HPGCJGGD_1622 [Methylobacterium haplocladii]GLS57961.1 hypothetical protein GCM10007887_06170 [Methylobacterium haplocladii]
MTGPETPTAETRWAGWARTFAYGLAGLVAGYLALAYAIDPYDSGRSSLLSVDAVRPQGPRTSAAVRGRDPAYRGAIFGNSHIQLIDPGRLSQATGIPFVQLSVTATGPGEQFTLMDWYLRHHAAPRALVVSADNFWCTDDPHLSNDKPFPFWLFSDRTVVYLRGLLRWSVLEELSDRIGWLLRKRHETAPRDGWWDYEADYSALGYAGDPVKAAEREKPAPEAPEAGRAGPSFPAAERFTAIAAALPAETALILVFPPIYAAALPRPGTPRARAEQACKAALIASVRGHRRSAVLDWRRDGPEARDPALFFDQSHYRHPLARKVAADIAAAIARLEGDARAH